MTGISSKIGTIAIAKQSGKGVAAANPTVKAMLSGAPSIMPVKEVGRYEMTDAGRDAGVSFTSRLGVAGDFQCYAHPALMALLNFLSLGSNADSGAGPNYTHTATPANDVSYCTIWRMVGNVIFEKFVDCKVNSFRLEWAAGTPLTVTVSVEGITSAFEAADTVLAPLDPVAQAGYLHMEANGLITIAGGAIAMTRGALEITNNVSPFQADDYFPEDIDPGQREVGLSYAVRFEGPTIHPKYRRHYYGSDVGTALSPIITTEAMVLLWRRNANTEIKYDLPQVGYVSVPVSSDPGGDPIEVEVATNVEKPAGSPIITATTKDQVATV